MALKLLLPWAVALPALVGLLLLSAERVHRGVRGSALPRVVVAIPAIGAALFAFGAAIALWLAFDPTDTSAQFVSWWSWIPDWGWNAFFALDGFGLWFLLLTSFLVLVLLLAAFATGEGAEAEAVAGLLILETAFLGAFAAWNLAFFAFFWELALLPLALALGAGGGEGRVRAVFRLFGVSAAGSLALWFAVVALAGLQAAQHGVPNLDMVAVPEAAGPALRDLVIPPAGAGGLSQSGIFAAFLVAFALRVPLWPLHAWNTVAQQEAPRAVASVVASVFVGLGIFGLLRFALPLCPDTAAAWAPAFVVIATIGVGVAGLLALAEPDLKRIVASLSIVQLAIALIGVFALNAEGLTGSVFLVLSHALAISALLFLVGALERRRGTTRSDAFGGVARPMPGFAALLVLVVLACLGTPLFSNFVGAFLVLLGAFQSRPAFAAAATLLFVLAAMALFRALRIVCYGPVTSPENRGLIDLGVRERLVVGALLVPLLWAGLDPQGVLRPLQPSVLELLRTMGERSVAADADLRAPEIGG